jgi:hypothetical protein
VNIQFPQPFVEDPVFLQHNVFGAFVEDQMAIAVWIYFWIFY